MGVLVGAGSRLLVQGITGREAAGFVRDSLDYGARVVAGVTPGRGGQTVHGVPVYDSVRDAIAGHEVDVSVVSVPPWGAADAGLEALEAGIPLVVVLTERIPRKDVAELVHVADRRGATVVGPNSVGVITPGQTKVGPIGGPADDCRRAYSPGRVGIMSRSGGMTTEIASLLSQCGIGQSTAVSVGGDPIVGTTFSELARLFQEDPDTDAVVFFGEPGGMQELKLAEYVEGNPGTKPIIGFVAGRFADRMPGVRFGHAGAMVEPGSTGTQAKIDRLRAAGVAVAERLDDIPGLIRQGVDGWEHSSR